LLADRRAPKLRAGETRRRTMIRFAIVVAAALTLAGSARAQQPPQQLDLATVTCKEFVTSDKETVALVLMWLQAFYTEPDAKPVVDFAKMKSDGDRIAAYCRKNPDHNLLIAADNVLQK
jgi:acid stress chaperone HdeB